MLKLPQVHARTVPLLPAGKDGMVVDRLWPGSGPLGKGASEAALRARSLGSQYSEQILDVSWTVIHEASKALGIRDSSALLVLSIELLKADNHPMRKENKAKLLDVMLLR